MFDVFNDPEAPAIEITATFDPSVIAPDEPKLWVREVTSDDAGYNMTWRPATDEEIIAAAKEIEDASRS